MRYAMKARKACNAAASNVSAHDSPSSSAKSALLTARPIAGFHTRGVSRHEEPALLSGHNFGEIAVYPRPIEVEERAAGLPGPLRTGIERLSGFSMDDVRVYRNSSRPAMFRAQAYTLGTEIHIAREQERHLAHEAWHVVQQKQGRVGAANAQIRGTAVNDEAGLEREADEMGERALKISSIERGGQTHPAYGHRAPPSHSIQRKIMQRKKVPTGFGDFETTSFGAVEGKGVDITLTFTPDKKKVDAEKIALSQAIKNTNASGVDYPLGPTEANRMVPSGKPGAGYAIDQDPKTNNPIYFGTKNLGPKEELKDTPSTVPETDPDDPSMKRLTVNYELGYCYKPKGKKDKETHPAMLVDKVRYAKVKGESRAFETAAFAIEGADKDKYYGSVKWGYSVGETSGAIKIVPNDIELASPKKGEKNQGRPTENFLEAAKLWNAAQTHGTLKVIGDPANIHKEDGSDDTLAKDTELEQVGGVIYKGDPWIKAKVLDKAGKATSRTIFIKVSDVKDPGSGSLNKPLPIPK